MPSQAGSQGETAESASGGRPNAGWIILCLWSKMDSLHIASYFLANLWLSFRGWEGQAPVTGMRAMPLPSISPPSQTVACKLSLLRHLFWWILTAAKVSCSHNMLVADSWQALSHSPALFMAFPADCMFWSSPEFQNQKNADARSYESSWVKSKFVG